MLLTRIFLLAFASVALAAKTFKLKAVNPGNPSHDQGVAGGSKGFFLTGDVEINLTFLLLGTGILYNFFTNITIDIDAEFGLHEQRGAINKGFALDSDSFLTYQGKDLYACPNDDGTKLTVDCPEGTSVALKAVEVNNIDMI